ncbi:MAG TPA: hypothetical protein VK695_13860 [Steroidobacteraceae bacterium]|jgi:hypothetical protein|nr:hypothetical protein [Steroidobacteraceae bacterium]
MNSQPQSNPESAPFQLSLRVRHPGMDPAEISRAFAIEAEHSFRAGDARRSSSGVASSSVHVESYWLGELKPRGPLVDVSFPGDDRSKFAQKQLAAARRSLSWALSLSTSQFLAQHAELLRRIRAEGGEVSLLVSIFRDDVNSFTLAPEASRLFGELGITVEFELSSA